MTGNISKSKGFKGERGYTGETGPQGPQGLKGDKGDTPAIGFRYDEATGDLYYSSDGVLVDKEYISSKNLVTKDDLTEYPKKEEMQNVDNKVDEIISGSILVHTAQNADRALFDWNGNDIHLHYASKEEVRKHVDDKTAVIQSDIEGLQQRINEEAHFRGYMSTNAKIQAMEATPNDFAYSAESGTKWVYDAESGWIDTHTPVPDQLTPASDATPLINGVASSGTATEYSRADHRHPTDTTRVGVEEFNVFKSELETGLDTIIAIQNTLIGGGSV